MAVWKTKIIIYLNKFDFTRPNGIFSNLNKRIPCRKLSYASVVPRVLLANNQDALSRTQVQVKVWLSKRVWAKLLTETPLSKEAPPRPARPKRFPMPVVLSSALDCKFFFTLRVLYFNVSGLKVRLFNDLVDQFKLVNGFKWTFWEGLKILKKKSNFFWAY